MENHLSRQEIQEALSTGYGQSRRYSNTLSTQTLYVALSLPDGSVLRVASEQSSVMALLLGLVPSLILVSALIGLFGHSPGLPPLPQHQPAHSGAGSGPSGGLRYLRGIDPSAAPDP